LNGLNDGEEDEKPGKHDQLTTSAWERFTARVNLVPVIQNLHMKTLKHRAMSTVTLPDALRDQRRTAVLPVLPMSRIFYGLKKTMEGTGEEVNMPSLWGLARNPQMSVLVRSLERAVYSTRPKRFSQRQNSLHQRLIDCLASRLGFKSSLTTLLWRLRRLQLKYLLHSNHEREGGSRLRQR
jgi:hypothetical protein